MSRPKKSLEQNTDIPFKRLRLKARMTQEGLARELRVAVSTIRRWEKRHCEPTMTISQMRHFCQVTKIDFKRLPESLIFDD